MNTSSLKKQLSNYLFPDYLNKFITKHPLNISNFQSSVFRFQFAFKSRGSYNLIALKAILLLESITGHRTTIRKLRIKFRFKKPLSIVILFSDIPLFSAVSFLRFYVRKPLRKRQRQTLNFSKGFFFPGLPRVFFDDLHFRTKMQIQVVSPSQGIFFFLSAFLN